MNALSADLSATSKTRTDHCGVAAGKNPIRILLCNVFKPFTIPNEYNAPGNMIEHGLIHRSFTKRQGMFTINQQCLSYPLHLMAYNLCARTTVLEFSSLEEFAAEVDQGYDIVGIGCGASTLGKARKMCEVVKKRSPRTQTVIGGGGTMAIGERAAPFSDHICRGDGVTFMRELIGDPQGPIRFPFIPSVIKKNSLLGLPAHSANYVVAVGLGCKRGCEFCSTSHQFGNRYTPLFDSGAELFAFMKDVERYEASQGRHPQSIGFLIYDENFLMNRRLVDEFRRLNREQLLSGTQFLCFVFSDAKVISEYSMDELLEIGVDSVWVGVESPTLANFDKLVDVDIRRLCHDLEANGIKTFASMIAGLEQHTEELLRQDIEFALSLPTTAVQYAPVDPIPGTPYFRRLEQQGMIPDRDLKYFSMSHYNLLHPTLDERTVLGLIDHFLDRDYEENGPLVYRFLAGRWHGYLNNHRSQSPYRRARAEVFKRDVLRGYPVMLIGEVYAPTTRTRELFRTLRCEVQQHFKRRTVLRDGISGKLPHLDCLLYLTTSLPGLRLAAQRLLTLNAVLKDPRTRGFWEPLLDWQGSLEQSRHGMIPWEQPETIRTEYPLGGPAWRESVPRRARLNNRS